MLHVLRDRKADSVNEMTRRLQAITDHLWHEPFNEAYRKITWAAQNNRTYVFIRLPFPFNEQQNELCEWVANYWAGLGYSLRPGGSAGYGQDIIRLERAA